MSLGAAFTVGGWTTVKFGGGEMASAKRAADVTSNTSCLIAIHGNWRPDFASP